MSNPIIARTEVATSATPMTVGGVAKKTAFLLSLSAITAIALFFYGLSINLSSGMLYGMAIASMLISFVLALVGAFKPHLAKGLAVPFSLCEGVFLGAVSLVAYRFYPSVPFSALSATFVTAAIMLGFYVSGVIKVTQKLRSIVMSAVFAIMIVYAIQLLLRLIFGSSLPYLFDGGLIAIGFSVFVIVIASFTLLLDFDNVEQHIDAGVDESYEWIHSMGILSTLVWMYIEFVRLLGYLQD